MKIPGLNTVRQMAKQFTWLINRGQVSLSTGDIIRRKNTENRKSELAASSGLQQKSNIVTCRLESGMWECFLKAMLLECVMLVHPGFDEPFIFSTDVS